MNRKEALLHNLGQTVRDLRKELGYTRRQLAGRSGISERFLAEIESGRANPSLLRTLELADGLGTTPEGLLRGISNGHVPSGDRHQEKSGIVALLGLRGAGKSTVGADLAKRLGREFVELDACIEQEVGLSLGEIFEVHGEIFYRRTERRVLEALIAQGNPMVLATGGGLVTERSTFDLIRLSSYTVWLHAEAQDHWVRVVSQGDTRPMGDDDQAFTHLCDILGEREKLYQQAEVTIHTSGKTVEEVTEELLFRFSFLSSAKASGT